MNPQGPVNMLMIYHTTLNEGPLTELGPHTPPSHVSYTPSNVIILY